LRRLNTDSRRGSGRGIRGRDGRRGMKCIGSSMRTVSGRTSKSWKIDSHEACMGLKGRTEPPKVARRAREPVHGNKSCCTEPSRREHTTRRSQRAHARTHARTGAVAYVAHCGRNWRARESDVLWRRIGRSRRSRRSVRSGRRHGGARWTRPLCTDTNTHTGTHIGTAQGLTRTHGQTRREGNDAESCDEHGTQKDSYRVSTSSSSP
jgi:hypothetical protein